LKQKIKKNPKSTDLISQFLKEDKELDFSRKRYGQIQKQKQKLGKKTKKIFKKKKNPKPKHT